MKRIATEETVKDKRGRVLIRHVTYDDGTSETTYPTQPGNWRDRLLLAIAKRFDKWTAPFPQCPWRSGYDRRCEYKAGHGGQCMTIGPGKQHRRWYGINYNIVEGLPVPKGQAH